MSSLALAPRTAERIREAIGDADGNEIFFMVFPDERGVLSEFRILARGNAHAVPAITNLLKPGDIVVHNHPSGDLTPSDADLEVASRLGNLGIGVYLTDNNVESFYAVVEPQEETGCEPLDAAELENLLSPRGPVADRLRDYEFREGQIAMMKAVVDGFNSDKIVTVEAGTGTGKTLAYLIPAIKWALLNRERCLVSTNTINLQEQIIKKDIPFLESVFGGKFKAVLVKGRSNYLCLRRAESEARDLGFPWNPEKKESGTESIRPQGDIVGEDNDEEREESLEELRHILRWAHSTADGSLTDLSIQPRQGVWERVQCEIDSCTRMKCRYYDSCFLVKARREAAFANLLIVNHHLFCADLALRFETQSYADVAVLPPYHRVIIDEAHHLEMVATEYFGMQVSKGGFSRLLGRLYSEKGGRESQGIMSRIRTKFILRNKGKEKPLIVPLIRLIEKEIIPRKERVLDTGTAFFDKIRLFAAADADSDSFERKLRITPEIRERNGWKEEIIPSVHEIIRHLHELVKCLEEFVENAEPLSGAVKKELEDDFITVRSLIARLRGTAESFHRIFFEDGNDDVKWIELEARTRGTSIAVKSAPLRVAPELADSLFTPFKTVVLTSATIAVGVDFSYLHRRLGVDTADSKRRIDRIIESPFNYAKQVVIGIPTTLPDPGETAFPESANKFIGRALLYSGGRAFVLFTSYKMLNNAYQSLSEPLSEAGILVLKHGTENRSRLIETFRRDISSVLFGTDSFWEGVDVEGSALEMVIITRLPFRVPTEPVIEARVEDIEKNGGNAFYEYTVPQAVIKFKQGFGRLIRRRTDRGMVIILDKRVKSKAYGRMFLESLPKCRIASGEADLVLAEIKNFFADK